MTARKPASRPSTTRKHTRASEDKRTTELDESFGVRIDGKDFVLTPADITGVQEMRIRRETGYSVATLLHALQTSPGVDLIGIFVWIVEWTGNHSDATLEEVLGRYSYGSDVDIVGDTNASEPPPET